MIPLSAVSQKESLLDVPGETHEGLRIVVLSPLWWVDTEVEDPEWHDELVNTELLPLAAELTPLVLELMPLADEMEEFIEGIDLDGFISLLFLPRPRPAGFARIQINYKSQLTMIIISCTNILWRARPTLP